jgi:hypothetical protein
MSKKWYNYFVSVEQPGGGMGAPGTAPGGPPNDAAKMVADIAASVEVKPEFAGSMTTSSSFDEIYRAAEIRGPSHGYTIYKLAEMLHSEHIRSMPPEMKRNSILLALEAAGVKLQDIIEDAVRRDKALDTFEGVQRKSVEALEAKKTEENRQIQAEIDRLVAEHRARIQANSEAIAREKERFASWLRDKQAEEMKIADAIGYFVPANPITVSGAPQAADLAKPNPAR